MHLSELIIYIGYLYNARKVLLNQVCHYPNL
jgi:hypothetical protein